MFNFDSKKQYSVALFPEQWCIILATLIASKDKENRNLADFISCELIGQAELAKK